MQSWSILFIAAMALIIWLLSSLREKRVHAFTDAYCKAFVEAAEHIGAHPGVQAALNTERTPEGNLRVLPADDQPETVRAMLAIGADEYIMERLRAMYDLRDKAQAQLSAINLIGKKYNAVLNSTYKMANMFFLAVSKPGVIMMEKDCTDAQYFLQRQRDLRNTTLASIASVDCAREIKAE